jgi:hypothetical protein
VQASYVDIGDIERADPAFVQAMQGHSIAKDRDKDKYVAKLFYMSPLYPKASRYFIIINMHFFIQAFPKLDKLIFLDSSDLDFRDDISLVWDQFEQMEGSQVVGVGLDMSPHYRHFLEQNYTK